MTQFVKVTGRREDYDERFVQTWISLKHVVKAQLGRDRYWYFVTVTGELFRSVDKQEGGGMFTHATDADSLFRMGFDDA